MSKIIKERRGGERNPAKPPEGVDRFLPLAELWAETTNATGGGNSPQERAAEQQRRQDELLEEARREAERIRKEAQEEGYARGVQEGRQAGQEQYDRAVHRLEEVLAALNGEIGARNARHEEELLALIKAMVDRLVHHEISVNEKVIRACLREALQYVARNARITVHLHADDFERLREASLEDSSLLEGKDHLQLVEDSMVAAGGCRLETDFGEIDATLDTCRQRLYETVDLIFREQTDQGEPGR